MSGRIVVSKSDDWLTPWEVTVEPEIGRHSTAKFAAPARAHRYLWEQADATGFEVEFALDVSRVPLNSGSRETSSRRTVTPSEFAARMERRCSKCRESLPLNRFREEWRQNKTNRANVQFGWAEKCLACEEAAA